MDYGTIADATSLEGAINRLWIKSAALIALVPVDLLITGRQPPSNKMPYVRLETQGGPATMLTNVNEYANAKVLFHIWTDTVDQSIAIEPLIYNLFANIVFDWGTGGVRRMNWDGPAGSKQPNLPEIKAWETVAAFTCETWQTRQDTPAITSSSGD